MSGAPKIRVGIGGWVFPPWRGVFYPAELPQAQLGGVLSGLVAVQALAHGAHRVLFRTA